MNLFDNTLRDGGNVVGHGFDEALTVSIVKNLLDCGIRDIEMGNCKGLGAYEQLGAVQAPSDDQYLAIVQPYLSKGRIGMFMLARCAQADIVEKAAGAGLSFLRVGANAGEGAGSLRAVELVKKAGLTCRYSLMKAYISAPRELADEAAMLADAGVDKITIMDSAGTMFPRDAGEYVSRLKERVSIPVGFHGHSNLGLSQANALAAAAAGADEIDCGLLGMARSAGNCATELAAAALQKEGYDLGVDLFKLLDYLDNELIPAMRAYDYRAAVGPTDAVLGLAGCHSSFMSMFQTVAAETDVSLRRLIAAVSAINQRNPSEELLRKTAEALPRVYC